MVKEKKENKKASFEHYKLNGLVVKDYQGGGFFKYYELEQYEESLANCKYEDGDLFSMPDSPITIKETIDIINKNLNIAYNVLQTLPYSESMEITVRKHLYDMCEIALNLLNIINDNKNLYNKKTIRKG